MFKNYFKTAFRNFWKNKFYTGINITGLAIGLATCLLIMLYVLDELNYDKYNSNADRIYRINNDIKFGGNHFDLAVSPALMGATAVKELPQVEQYTRLRGYGSFLVKKGNENLRETNLGLADSTLFDVFTLPMISGNPKTALRNPHSLVITETIAKKYFNRTDVAGQSMIINDSINYKITGVIKDVPEQSHFKYDFFIAASEDPGSSDDNWLSENWNTYLLLKKNADPVKAAIEVEKMSDRYIGPEIKTVLNTTLDDLKKSGSFIHCTLTPLTDIHLHSNKTAELAANSSIQYVYIFSAIAIFILLIACVNFMNLTTARSSNRAREIGVRKVLGSLRKNLILQFLIESLLMSCMGLLLAILIALLVLPLFNQLSGKNISFNLLLHPSMLAIMGLLVITVGTLAGSYPALYLSAFQPVDVLKGKLAKGFKGSWLRNALVVFQFSISIVLMVGTIVIYNQLAYIRSKDIGFNREQLLTIQNIDALNTRANAFKNEVQQMSGIENATISSYLPVNSSRSNDAFFTSPSLDQKTAISMQTWTVDEKYIPTFNMQVLQGRNFSSQFPTDSSAIIVNEATLKFLAANDVLNKKIYEINDIKTKSLKVLHIIGVVKNFNFASLRDVVTPLALHLGDVNGGLTLRVKSSNIPALIAQIKNKWQAMAPGQPFDYAFMDEEFNNLYQTEQRTGKIFVTFAVLAILIACLGLFGLVAYAAEQRTKEIGIRKVLGATVGNIVGILSKDFFKLVIISAAIAFPIGWWVMDKWLEDFAYRIHISWWIFAIAGILSLLIALITVSFQAIKAAIANPVKSLRTE